MDSRRWMRGTCYNVTCCGEVTEFPLLLNSESKPTTACASLEYFYILHTKNGECVFFLFSSPKNPSAAASCPSLLAPPVSPLSAPLRLLLRSLVPLPTAGCAIQRSSGKQGNSKSCRRPGAWLHSPLAYPRMGNGGRRRSLSPPRGCCPPLPRQRCRLSSIPL
jgi:hypothetical protein